MNSKDIVIEKLQSLGINFTRLDHQPITTMDEGKAIANALGVVACKNVFHRNISVMMHRYILVLISVFFSLCAYSQNNIAIQLNDVLLSHDMAKGEKLISKITKQDIVNMPDSVLLDYHYLAAAICQEKGNNDEAAAHLQKVKDLCETKIGIFNDIRRYLEIVRVLGELCEDQGKDDEALLLYEEGIVKAFAFLQVKDKDLQEYIKELRDLHRDRMKGK